MAWGYTENQFVCMNIEGSIYHLTLLPYFEIADADFHRQQLNPASLFL
ncbi:MAG: hypothetical protein GWN16_15415 [Calditrichae bacterium]|nr:hypothetical protein [Calditrichia bacterium]